MTIRAWALGLFSCALFLLELGLTRLFATRYYPPLVFVILSIAVLGIGLGAALATWQPAWRRPQLLAYYVAGVALSMMVLVLAATAPLSLMLLLPLAVLPFLGAGLLLATLFSHAAPQSPQLYFADLVGAGLGVLLAIPLFGWAGLLNGMASAIIALTAAGLLFHAAGSPVIRQSTGSTLLVVLFCLITGVALAGIRWFQPTPLQLFAEKPIAATLAAGGKVVATHWDSFARTDLIDPGHGLPYELYLDGAAGSVMPPAAGHSALWRDIGFFPFATEQPARVFVIGPGGGLDIWFGLQSGTEEIVAAEVNPASIALLTAYRVYNGNLAGQEQLRLVAGEGRSVLAREGHFYDLIFLSQVVTLAAERSGYALVENRAYTEEAFATYLAHLRPEGMMAFKLYDEPTLLRALATALTALQRYGLTESEALQQMIILVDPKHDPAIPLLMVRNTPFSRDEALSIGAVANDVGFQPLFLPNAWATPPFDAVVSGNQSFAELIATTPEQLQPTTDDRPFFFLFERGLPQVLQPLIWGIGAVVIIGIVLLFIMQRGPAAGRRHGYTLYFAALGLGFMVIELNLIQQTQRFVGHPTTAVTVVLATLLVGAGLGSNLVGRWLAHRPQRTDLLQWPLFAILIALACWLLLWPWLDAYFFGYPQLWRIVTLVCYLLPLALFLGMPFPLGLRAVGQLGEEQVGLAWAVNGVASVAGALLTIAGAMLWGYHLVAIVGWFCYLVALLWVIIDHKSHSLSIS
ncbi:MAG: hypothetical protein R2932_23500 [Caldilineaceae bacterium]